ncbi:pogo transposable element with krab domain [Plakobranchus ocellatus]|uniref:Pogo transposable element with krab domain n=1 Tax=Plakobranchus ocellatus TaxID=259542 RepID=A0AAV3YD76_9GAST|nr:pogo transposable element with krab domain [Plakobranchus ocellatus]
MVWKFIVQILYSQAPSRKASSRGRKRGKSMVATSTPEMKRIKEEALKKMQKTQKSQAAVSSRRLTFDVEDDDSASDISLTDLMDESEDVPERDAIKLGVVENVSVNDYVLCEFAKKAHKFYYVGQMTKERDSDDDVEADFLRRKGSYFVKPLVEDISSVHIDSIKALLPQPTVHGTTLRTKGELVFSTEFGHVDVR